MVTVRMTLEHEPADLLADADRPLADVARERLVLVLFRRAEISRGYAARLLGLDLLTFLRLASSAGVPVIDLTTAELQEEMEVIRKRWPRTERTRS